MNKNIIDINVPSLNDINYATSLNEVFNNINKNFSILSNHEFIKGNDGKSIEIVETPFFTNGTINEFGNMLKECIESLGDTETTIIHNGIEYTIWDKFTAENAGVLQLIYNSDFEPISSLQYVFLDGRFSNNVIGIIDDQSQYDNISDLSCVVVYDKTLNGGSGGFRALNNSISTLYYNSNLGLCWKINGVETGIPAQGIPGKNGEKGKIYLVKSKLTRDNNVLSGEVTHIYTKNQGFISITEKTYAEVYAEVYADIDDSTVLILANTDETNDTVLYFGSTYTNIDNKLCVVCDIESDLNKIVEIENITNYFKQIDLMHSTDTNTINGLFIPINHIENGNQPVHLISARYEGKNNFDTDVDSLNYNDVIITPINDINNLKIDDNNVLCVDRYIKFYDDMAGYVSYKLIKSINSKNTFITCIKIDGILEKDTNTLLTNLPIEFKDLLDNGLKIYQWCNDDVNDNHYSIFTIDVNPTPNSIVLLTEKIDDNDNLVCDTTRRIIDFVPEFNNSFKTLDNASLNINYDVNIAKESTKSANLNVNGEISANSMRIGNRTEYVDIDTNMPIYDGDLFVGSSINVGDSTGVIRAGQLDLGRTMWSLRPNSSPTKSRLIIDNGLPNLEGFESTLVINTDVKVDGNLIVSDSIQTNAISTEHLNLGKGSVILSNNDFTFDNLGNLVVMNYDNKPFILLKSNMPDFDNPDDIAVGFFPIGFDSENKQCNVPLPTLSRWGEQCVFAKFNVGVQNYNCSIDLEDQLLGIVLPVDKFKYEINISPDPDVYYNYRYLMFILDFPNSIDINLIALKSTNAFFSYDFELKLVCNDKNRTIIKKSITNLNPRFFIKDFNSLKYMLDLKTNSFSLIDGKELVDLLIDGKELVDLLI